MLCTGLATEKYMIKQAQSLPGLEGSQSSARARIVDKWLKHRIKDVMTEGNTGAWNAGEQEEEVKAFLG